MLRSVVFRLFVSACVTYGLVFPVTVVAGTTGSLTGVVTDAKTHQPLAEVTVSVVSPSQSVKATTDANGHFTFISLAPDTYTLGLTRQGYESLSTPGISVFADQNQSLQFTLQSALREIGRVSARSSLDVVRPGTTSDVYSVDSAVTAAAAPIGGGGSLNNAYSAIAAVPGVFVPPGQSGVNQTVYIRGGYYDQIGYEYDGVPVNRSFDNYPGHSASTLGQQELQIYTGGGGAGASASGLAGFINQVVRSGTYPGFANFSMRAGSPTFYHDLSAEVGGSTPDRRFSYYFGLSGYNQDFRYYDNFNGAGQENAFPNGSAPYYSPTAAITTLLPFNAAVYPTCNKDLTSPLDAPGARTPPWYNDPGCFAAINPAYGSYSAVNGRETVANFHFALPHRNDGGRDDIQLLFTNSSQYRQAYSSVNDAGYSLVYSPAIGGAEWPDYVTYPSGTSFLAPANAAAIAYPFPGSPGGRCYNTPIPVTGSCPAGTVSALPPDYRDARWDSASILKLQYQKNLGSRAYVRLFGYTFYSNTNRSGATGEGIGNSNYNSFGAINYDYEVDSHTRGVELQFADQISDRNQVTGWINYVTASTLRLKNFNDSNSSSQQVSNLTNGQQCFAAMQGTATYSGDVFNAGQRAPCNDPITQGTFALPTNRQAVTCATTGSSAIPGPACAAGAAWRLTYTGNQGALNTVRPKFAATALNDEWKPFDKLDINAGLRLERDEYDLADTNTPDKNFWYAAAQQEYCYNPVTLQPAFVPQSPQNTRHHDPFVTFSCPLDSSSGTPVQTVHPDGKNGHLLLSNTYNPTLVQNYLEPRVGLTYTLEPGTVLRASAGRYVQQPQAYEVQYNSVEPNLANQLIGFLPYGFTTPRHDALPQYSNNFDLSLEHRFSGSDVSLKFTPYFRYATNQLYTESVYGQSPALNTGVERSQGFEFELLKGDFKKNGLSALFSYTYLDSKERWTNFANTQLNPVDPFNQYVQQYNALTKGGGGAACYVLGTDANGNDVSMPDPTCAPITGNANQNAHSTIRNPYYGSAPQHLFDKNAFYDTGLDAPYLSPNVFTAILNYRHAKFSITPEVTLNEGASYGSPNDVIGLDPRTCKGNQGDSGFTSFTAGSPLSADYTSCKRAATPSGNVYVPNPQTGHYDGFGEFRQPWQLNAGLQMSYDISRKVTANLTVANLFNRCFGGSSTPWTSAFPPSSSICGYTSNTFYVNDYYNGSSANDIKANGVALNPYFAQSFAPAYGDTSSFNFPTPLNIYFQLQFKL